jgi:hypothetical protein
MAGMDRRVTRPGLVALIPAGLVAAALTLLITGGGWQAFGIWTEPSVIGWSTGFADLANQTATADCIRAGTDITTCDPYGRTFQPYAVFPGSVMAALGLGVRATGVIGVLLAACYVFVIWLLACRVGRAWQGSIPLLIGFLAVMTVASLSPPALLLVERGQIEILILGLATIGLLAFTRTGAGRRGLGSVALFLSVVLKYFNLGVFLAFLAPRRWSWWAGAALAASIAFLVLNFGDVSIAREAAGATDTSTSRVMFGSATLLVTLAVEDPAAFTAPDSLDLPTMAYRGAGIGLLIIFTLLWWLWLRGAKVESPRSLAWYWIVGAMGSVTLPYLLGGSNDYRLTLLMPALAGVGVWIGQRGPAAPLFTLAALLTITLWTNAWMIPTPSGWDMPEFAIIIGEVALSATLAFGLALVARAWTHRSLNQESA